MKNKFYANIMLCDEFSENKGISRIEHPFNQLTIKEGDNVKFTAVIAWNREIVEQVKATLVLGVHHKDGYFPVATNDREYKIGNSYDFMTAEVDLEVLGEGTYAFEVRIGENADFKKGDVEEEDILQMFEQTEVVSKYFFDISYEK